MILCDYILSQSSRFTNSVVMELGGGTGLSSIVMATIARTVICTGKDFSDKMFYHITIIMNAMFDGHRE